MSNIVTSQQTVLSGPLVSTGRKKSRNFEFGASELELPRQTGESDLHWPLHGSSDVDRGLPFLRHPDVVATHAWTCVRIEVEALTPAASCASVAGAWPMKVLKSHRDGPAAMYSVFLRLISGAAERVADFATCLEAVDYASAIMGMQWNLGRCLPRCGELFGLQCAVRTAGVHLYLGRNSTVDAPEWIEDPASALVFGRDEANASSLVTQALRGEEAVRKCSWLAAQVLHARAAQARAPEICAVPEMDVWIGMATVLDLVPSFATLHVSPDFASTLLRLQRLCQHASLKEIRAETTAVYWGSPEVFGARHHQRGEMIVTPALVRFASLPSARGCRMETVALDVVEFMQAVQSYRWDEGTLVVDLHGIAKVPSA